MPTMGEFVPGYEGGSWFGLGAPLGTPSPAVARISAALNHALNDTVVRTRLDELGASIMSGSAAAFAAFIWAETNKYRAILRTAGIQPPMSGGS